MDAPAEQEAHEDERDGCQFDPERDLRILCEELYEGNWELMLQDLENRLHMKPPIYKITENLHADIEVIKRIIESERSDSASSAKSA